MGWRTHRTLRFKLTIVHVSSKVGIHERMKTSWLIGGPRLWGNGGREGGGGYEDDFGRKPWADEVQRLSIPYYHIINNDTQGEILYYLNTYLQSATDENNVKNSLICNTLFKNRNNQCVSQPLNFFNNSKGFFFFALWLLWREFRFNNINSTIWGLNNDDLNYVIMPVKLCSHVENDGNIIQCNFGGGMMRGREGAS